MVSRLWMQNGWYSIILLVAQAKPAALPDAAAHFCHARNRVIPMQNASVLPRNRPCFAGTTGHFSARFQRRNWAPLTDLQWQTFLTARTLSILFNAMIYFNHCLRNARYFAWLSALDTFSSRSGGSRHRTGALLCQVRMATRNRLRPASWSFEVYRSTATCKQSGN